MISAAVTFGSDCETCAQVTSDLSPGESSECPCCGRPCRRSGSKAPPQKREDNDKPRWRLLKDCVLIAGWDAMSHARAQTMGDSSGVPEDPEVPAWDERRHIVRLGRPLRGRLDALVTRGRSETAARRAHFAASPTGPYLWDSEISPIERAGAVIEWLVPRARTYLHSAGGGFRPVERDLPHDLAKAFTVASQWAAWNPMPPAPLVTPKNRPKPEPAEPPREPDSDAQWWQRRLYLEVTLPAYLVRLESLPAALDAWEHRFDTWPVEQRQHAELLARHARAVEAGSVGIRRTGVALLRLAETEWSKA